MIKHFEFLARGACCLQFGHCDDRSSPDVCAAKGGSFNGLATKCDSKTCGKKNKKKYF